MDVERERERGKHTYSLQSNKMSEIGAGENVCWKLNLTTTKKGRFLKINKLGFGLMMKNQSLVHQGGSFSWGFQMVSEGKKQL